MAGTAPARRSGRAQIVAAPLCVQLRDAVRASQRCIAGPALGRDFCRSAIGAVVAARVLVCAGRHQLGLVHCALSRCVIGQHAPASTPRSTCPSLRVQRPGSGAERNWPPEPSPRPTPRLGLAKFTDCATQGGTGWALAFSRADALSSFTGPLAFAGTGRETGVLESRPGRERAVMYALFRWMFTGALMLRFAGLQGPAYRLQALHWTLVRTILHTLQPLPALIPPHPFRCVLLYRRLGPSGWA